MAQAVKTVVVTGFEPFQSHKINSSWEVAKELTNLKLESHGIKIITEELPVVYGSVEKQVPTLWKKFSPKLVVHMGLTALSSEIKIETIAHCSGYHKVDSSGSCPPGGSCKGEKQVLCSQFDLIKVANKIRNMTDVSTRVEVSCDAGRYVCEFTYFTSLNIDNSRSVFIHVPDINKPYSVKEMANCVKHIILCLLDEISLQEFFAQ